MKTFEVRGYRKVYDENGKLLVKEKIVEKKIEAPVQKPLFADFDDTE